MAPKPPASCMAAEVVGVAQVVAREAVAALEVQQVDQTHEVLQAHLRRRARPALGSAHGRLELLALAGRVTKAEVLGELAWEAGAA